MTPWTLLIITMLSPISGMESAIAYPTPADCAAAVEAVSRTIPYGHQVRCEQIGAYPLAPATSLRPKPNPRIAK